jgi:hypothetical protein
LRTVRLDALAPPGFLLCQALIHLFPMARFGLERFLLALQKRVVITVPVAELAAVEFDDARGQPPEE